MRVECVHVYVSVSLGKTFVCAWALAMMVGVACKGRSGTCGTCACCTGSGTGACKCERCVRVERVHVYVFVTMGKTYVFACALAMVEGGACRGRSGTCGTYTCCTGSGTGAYLAPCACVVPCGPSGFYLQ